VRIFVLYILATQEPETAQSFRDVLRQHAPEVGEDLMTYAQELLKEGEIRAEVRIIENLLREGMEWPAIERITGVNETHFQALKRRLEAMHQ
jgi:recombination-promoting nuclease RpnB